MKIWNLFADLLFPRLCLICGAEDQWLCLSCRLQLTEEAEPLPQQAAPLPIFACLPYEHRMQHLIQGYKYDGLRELADSLAKIMCPTVEKIAAQCKNPALIPAPMSEKRRRERGFNHTELLVQSLGAMTSIPIAAAALKPHHTLPQVGLDRGQRQKNLCDAFRWDERIAISERDCIIIDDVCTTGSTINAIGAALQEGHPASLRGLTLAYEPL